MKATAVCCLLPPFLAVCCVALKSQKSTPEKRRAIQQGGKSDSNSYVQISTDRTYELCWALFKLETPWKLKNAEGIRMSVVYGISTNYGYINIIMLFSKK